MKITIEQPKLARALSGVTGIVERKNTIPILAHVLIDANNGGIMVRGTDLDIEVTSQAEANVEVNGCLSVSASMLSDIVKRLPKGSLIALYEDGGFLHIKSGQAEFKLSTLPVNDFPVMASEEYDNVATLDADTMADLFNKCKFAMSNEETRYYLQGVYLHNDDEGNLVGVATDGHRLAKYSLASDATVSGVIVPSKTVNEVTKLLATCDTVTVETSETKIKFTGPDFVVVSKVIDGTFPDYTRVIPQGNNKEMTVNAKEFASASGLVALASDDRTRVVKLSVADDVCSLTVQGVTANGADEVVVSYQDEPFSTGFNSKYLAEMMSQAEGGDVTMVFGATMDPAIVRMSEVPEFVGVVMPMRS